MIISIPMKPSIVRLTDGTQEIHYELVPGFARIDPVDRADTDAAAPTGHLLISNPLIEWAMDMVNRGNLAATEKIYLRFHSQPDSNYPDGTGLTLTQNPVDVTDNSSFV